MLPYKDYDSATGLFINNKTVGFMFEARPLPGADKSIVATLEHLLRSKLPGASRSVFIWSPANWSAMISTMVCVNSAGVVNRLRSLTPLPVPNTSGQRRRSSLPPDLDLPLTLRNYRVYISCCVPRKKNSTTQIVEMENQIKILRASLGGAYIPTRILDASGLVELMRELINPDPHEMYRVPYKLDPYQDLNYQCVDDSFDMQVTAGHLKIGRLGRDGKSA
ncbi:TraC family protein [Klebsiella pneumoniae]|nr:TraC family protein [Klebsiella pneumoniae]